MMQKRVSGRRVVVRLLMFDGFEWSVEMGGGLSGEVSRKIGRWEVVCVARMLMR